MSNIPSILSDATYRRLSLEKLTGIAGFQLPAYDQVDFGSYVVADKPSIIVLKNGGSIVATLTLSYDGSNNLTSVVRS